MLSCAPCRLPPLAAPATNQRWPSPRPIIRVLAPADDPPTRPTIGHAHEDQYPLIIDTFQPTPRLSVEQPSGRTHNTAPAYENFLTERSRVLRLFNLPPAAASFLSAVFGPSLDNNGTAPATLWTVREDYPGPRPAEDDCVYAVFRTHEEARAALALDAAALLSVAPAREHDLLPFQKLQRLDLPGPASPMYALHLPPSPATSLPPLSPARPTRPCPTPLRSSVSTSDMHTRVVHDATRFADRAPAAYTLSSNPPAARASFRMGDWMCPAPNCAVHNFQRNLSCIGCGSPRPADGFTSPEPRSPPAWTAQNRVCPSPRFMGGMHGPMSHPPPAPLDDLSRLVKSHPAPHALISPGTPKTPAYPILTPSGRALAVGGKVQNVSTDPFTPCLMWWPDNEPLPEQSQIRPSGLIGVQHPPILNTGNRGPIEHQPGDWVCGKCSYLNWRRRKVCQTCFPYAEGNGDSISAAVQAERIALLASVIAKETTVSSPLSTQAPLTPLHHSQSPIPHVPQPRSSLFVDISPELQGSRSRTDLPPDDTSMYMGSRTIYQTGGHRQPSPPSPIAPARKPAPAPSALLPSFLHDIVRSPSLSPASTSSAFSLEECDEGFSLHAHPRGEGRDRTLVAKSSFSSLGGGSIWRLDGEESKALSSVSQLERQLAVVDIK